MCSGLSLVRHALTAVWCCSGAAVSGEDRAVPAAVGREPAPRLPPLARHPHHREPHLRGRGVLDARPHRTAPRTARTPQPHTTISNQSCNSLLLHVCCIINI